MYAAEQGNLELVQKLCDLVQISLWRITQKTVFDCASNKPAIVKYLGSIKDRKQAESKESKQDLEKLSFNHLDDALFSLVIGTTEFTGEKPNALRELLQNGATLVGKENEVIQTLECRIMRSDFLLELMHY